MKNKIVSVAMLLCILLSLAAGCLFKTGSGYSEVEKAEFLMGTLITVKVFDKNENKGNDAANRAVDRIRDIEALMSMEAEKSDVRNINKNAGIGPVTVSRETFEVIEKGLYYGELSGGLFDITIGPLVNIWGIGTDRAAVPEAEDIKDALELVSYKDVMLNKNTLEVFLKRKGMAIDLGGIAKGYAADEAKKVLVSLGIEHGIINLGGNVLTLGEKYSGGPWKIGIKDPKEPEGGLLGAVEVTDGTVVSSGDYERFFYKDGERYHHIMDPCTGYPRQGNIRGVTVINSFSVDADALSTTVFLMGEEEGMQLIEKLDGVEAVIVTYSNQVLTSSGLKGLLKLF